MKHLWMIEDKDPGSRLPTRTGEELRPLPPFSRLTCLWVPRQFVTSSGVDASGFIADLNETIRARGFITLDRQVLTTPIDPKGRMEVHFDPDEMGEPLDDVPAPAEWGARQRDYFGLENPCQMSEDSSAYTWANVTVWPPDPYLASDEQILGIVHGERDHYYFYCPCHYAEVVYTSRHRLVCMSCFATHLVLQRPLPLAAMQTLRPDEWDQYFRADGERRDEELEISVVDFQDIENAQAIWTTSQWEEARHEFVFFARSSPEEVAKAVRGTEMDPSALLEAGWTEVKLPPPPALQVRPDSVNVDLLENAGKALHDGVAGFLAARMDQGELVTSIPELFRCVELLLKAKLEDLDPKQLGDHPNMPTVLKRLASHGVSLASEELGVITRLRRVRNDLQHGSAKFNHRTGLTLCRRSIQFIDRFAWGELGLWIGDTISPREWSELLRLPELVATAEEVVGERLENIRKAPEATISACPRCNRQSLVQPDPNSGASCVFCGHVPVNRGDRDPTFETT